MECTVPKYANLKKTGFMKTKVHFNQFVVKMNFCLFTNQTHYNSLTFSLCTDQ